jgi:D-tyrosyl-tRNA(Tyr) deacylase
VRAVVQRVRRGSVAVDGAVVGAIQQGMVVFVGIGCGDTMADVTWLARKLVTLRIFPDERGRMSYALDAISGRMLVISQFTLFGDCTHGARPDCTKAAPPGEAKPLYQALLTTLEQFTGSPPACGVFGAHMDIDVSLMGPVTVCIDSKVQ